MAINQTELNVTNFFRYYLFHTDAKELTSDEKCRAKVWAVFTWLLTLCVIPIICRIAFYDRSFQIKKSDPKVSTVANPILNPSKVKTEEVEEKEDYEVLYGTFEEEDETLPSLPQILKLDVKKDTPLEKGLPAPCFDEGMKPDAVRMLAKMISDGENSDSNFLAKNLYATRYDEDDYSNLHKDRKILDIPIAHWIDQEGIGKESKAIINDPARAAIKEFIEQQLKVWDDASQLKDRIKRKKAPPEWTVKQLLVGWEKSLLKYSLMMNEELAQLKVSDMSKINESLFVKAASLRLMQISRRKYDEKSPKLILNKEMLPKVLLIDLYRMDACQFNQFATDLPPISLLLLPRKEIKRIDIQKITSEQLAFLATKRNLVEKLTVAQVKECLLKTDSEEIRKNLLSNLNEKQILDFDYKFLDQKMFDIMFQPGMGYIDLSTIHYSVGDKAIPKMSMDQIYQLEKFFSKKHWERLSDKQATELDFSKIEKKKEVFEIVFEAGRSVIIGVYINGNARERFVLLSIEKIMQLSQYFTSSHWTDFCFVGVDERKKFDFSKIGQAEEAKKFVNAIWSHRKEFFRDLTKAEYKILKPLLSSEAQKWIEDFYITD